MPGQTPRPLYPCPPAPLWAPGTAYQLNSIVQDATADLYRLGLIAVGTVSSGTTAPAGQEIFIDGGYVWALTSAPVCTVPK